MKGHVVAAVLLLVIGVVWLLDLLGWSVFPGGIGTWWPLILIVIGVAQLATSRGRWPGGVVLILVGAFFLARSLGFLPRDVWRYAGPVALIVVAVFLLVPGARRAASRSAPFGGSARGTLGREDTAVFGEQRLDAPAGEAYRGGEVTAVFGSLEADLTRATLPPEGARLKATGVFGGVVVRVPAGWRVEVHGTPILGKTENRAGSAAEGPRLDVEAVAVFGSVEVATG